MTEDQQFQDAMQRFNQKQWDQAYTAFDNFQKQFPRSRWKHAVELRLADLEPDPAKALEHYRSILAQTQETEWIADARWGAGLALFTLGQYQQALEQLEEVNPEMKQRHAHALYLTGLCQLALQKYAPAQENFRMLMDTYRESEWAGAALVAAGECALLQGNAADAVSAFDRYLREYPEGDFTSAALWQKAQALETQGLKAETANVLHELVTRYHESYEAEKAKGEVGAAQETNTFTIQVGAFTKREYAQKLANRLRKRGYNAYLLEAKSGTETYNQVRVGSYTSREFTEKIAAKISRQENLPYIILPYVKPSGGAP
ncbi:DUF3808 domain-containing protein [candidate division FCPU426 bacterium]|nr:DUF3808 domain-containing protein [candidate division FCPU426 bacterium]